MRTLKSLKQMALFEFRALMRNRIAFFFNLLLPVVLIAIFGSMSGDGFDFTMPGQLVYMLLAAGLMSIAIGLSTQRQNGSLRHLFTTPLSMTVWLAAQVIANMTLAAVQIVLIFAEARLLFGVHMPLNIPGTIATLFICSLTSLAMGLAVGALVKSPEAAFPMAMMLFLAFAVFGNVMMPMEAAPQIMRTFEKVTPSFYMTHALRLVMMQGKGLGAVAGDLGILAGCMAVFGSIAVWRIRRQVTAA